MKRRCKAERQVRRIQRQQRRHIRRHMTQEEQDRLEELYFSADMQGEALELE